MPKHHVDEQGFQPAAKGSFPDQIADAEKRVEELRATIASLKSGGHETADVTRYLYEHLLRLGELIRNRLEARQDAKP